MRFRPVTVAAVLMVAVTGCSGGGGGGTVAGVDIAATCQSFADAGTRLERRVVEADLFEQLEEQPSDAETPPLLEVLDAMRSECPDEVDELLGTHDADLMADIDLELVTCSDDETSGTVTNDGDVTVNVRVEVRFTTSSDVLVDTSSTIVSGLRPGQTGEWEVFFSDDMDHCSARVVQVTEA